MRPRRGHLLRVEQRLLEKLDARIQVGAALGLLAGACLSIALDSSGWQTLFATSLCGVSGGIVGLVLWLGCPELPEDPIAPVKMRSTVADSGAQRTRVDKKT